MSKALRTVATIAGAVALVATGIGAIGGAPFAATALGGTVANVATYAGLAAGVAGIGAQLTAKKPAAQGNISNVVIDTDAVQPYLMGRTYSGGVLRHDVGYGGEVSDVKNPYRGSVVVYSGCGPLEELVGVRTDYAAVSSWYSGFLHTDSQLGACPEATALSPYWAGMPRWGAAYKLSGKAAILWNFRFDKKGRRFASGLPIFGAIWKGVKVYDPRLDSTYPGGFGAQRIDDETTWRYSENPALHAIAYARGRHQNGRKVFGIGLPASGIDLAAFVAWANVCEANGWVIGGGISEPGDRWDNLKNIMVAGGAEPVFANGVLSVRFRAPKVALDTVTEQDLANEDASITAMQSYRARVNTVIPKYRSEEANWTYVAGDAVQVATYVAEDGEEKSQETQYNLVQDADQAAQLAAYDIMDARELGPISLPLKPQWRRYRPGECLHLSLPSLNFEGDAIILSRDLDPSTMKVSMTFVGETYAKHAFALGQTGTPPPTPSLVDPQERDETAAVATAPVGYNQQLIATSSQSSVLVSASDSAITIGDHTRIYSDGSVPVTGATLTEDAAAGPIAGETKYYLYYDDVTRAGGAVNWQATTDFFAAQTTDTNPARHYGGYITTDVTGGSGSSGGGSLPPGSGGQNPYPDYNVP